MGVSWPRIKDATRDFEIKRINDLENKDSFFHVRMTQRLNLFIVKVKSLKFIFCPQID